MNQAELKARTKDLAIGIIHLVDHLPNSVAGRAVANQLVRSGTSVGANYRACCRSRSTAEFISKLGVVIEEADESAYWIEVIKGSGLLRADALDPLETEANEFVAIFTAAQKTTKARNPKS